MAKKSLYYSATIALLLCYVWGVSVQAAQPEVKLSPQVRAIPHDDRARVPAQVINTFLREHRVLEEGAALKELAYVIGGEGQRLMSGAGDTLYVRGELPVDARLGIYREGVPYASRDGTPLGVELIHIGEARYLSSEGEIARLEVLSAHQEVRNNDILLTLEERHSLTSIQPRVPQDTIEGHIIAVPGGVRFIGQWQVVALDMGTQDGIQPGHILQVDQQGELVNDPRAHALVQLPAVEAGRLMVFKPYDRVSYALVTQATHVLAVGDRVRTPTL